MDIYNNCVSASTGGKKWVIFVYYSGLDRLCCSVQDMMRMRQGLAQ